MNTRLRSCAPAHLASGEMSREHSVDSTDTTALERFGEALGAEFLRALPVDGVCISVFPGHPMETVICASDATSGQIDELQFDLGDGPRWDAIKSRMPVSVPDVAQLAVERWPVFIHGLAELNVGALFVYPLTLGAMDVGIVELYAARASHFAVADHATALRLAENATWQILRQVLATLPDEANNVGSGRSALSRREIHQATGMVLAQTGGTAADALLIMRAHAFSQGQSVREVAHEVVRRILDFSPNDGNPIPPSVK